MKKFFGWLLAILIVAGGFLAFGGRDTIVALRKQFLEAPSARPRVSAEEQEKLKKSLEPRVLSTYQSDLGFARVYGDVTNGTSYRLVSATLEVTLKVGPKEMPGGRAEISDIAPSETRTFDIITTVRMPDVVDAQVRVTKAKFE